jgi:hypothetical protein
MHTLVERFNGDGDEPQFSIASPAAWTRDYGVRYAKRPSNHSVSGPDCLAYTPRVTIERRLRRDYEGFRTELGLPGQAHAVYHHPHGGGPGGC